MNNPSPKIPISYFISYARLDTPIVQKFLDLLKPQLDISKRYDFQAWQDSSVLPGEEWDDEIKTALQECKMGLLLITETFLARPYIIKEELPRLTDPSKILIPVKINPIDFSFQETWEIDRFQWFGITGTRGETKAFSECSTKKQREFVQKLYQSIELHVAKALG